ncbi:OmpA family protein [Poseidonibacter lekithochrous]|uniref:OmpA family protein n=1 Tax=Poseidonibacter lekithochrous TaxID=1904463 RepID=UPI000D36B822|nr:OmpA family protein [Poseidonibacter lekithochrous]
MKKIILTSVACASLMFAANSEYKYEVTPMFGSAFSEHNTDLPKGYSNAGLAVGFNLNDSTFDQVELGFLRSIEDVDYQNVANRDTGITRVFTNFVKDYPLNSNYSLYALVGAGLEFFDDEFAGNKDGLFGNYGAGLKIKVYENIAMKMDLRHVIETDHGDNTLLYNIGLAIPFGKVQKAAPKPMMVKETPKDSDNDRVIDAKDQCPNSIPYAVVNAVGCEMDDDKDGVVNRLDECPTTMAGAKVDALGCANLVDLDINFATNSAKIGQSYYSKIEKFATMMKNNTKLKATIEAHTDSVGSAAYNKKLSQKRANSTVEALKSLNVEESRLTAIGYGESKPLVSNDTAENRSKNRRVHAVISK